MAIRFFPSSRAVREWHRSRFFVGAVMLGIFVGTAVPSRAQELLWAKKAGGGATDEGQAIAVDSAGNSYVTGRFQGTVTFGPGEAGQTSLASGGLVDIFVAKYDVNGLLVWVRKAGGEGTNEGRAITVDSAGNSYVTGFFQNTATFGAGQANETTFSAQGGNADIFVAKYNTSGVLQWAKQAGSGTGDATVGGFADEGLGIGLDGSGNVYVTGFFQSTSIVFGPGEANETIINVLSGGREVFLAKFATSSGNLAWAIHAGGQASDEGHALAVDSGGNSYIAGSFNGTATFGAPPNTAQIVSGGGGDIFVAKYNTSGALVWVKSAGGGSDDDGRGIAVDGSGRIYVAGKFTGTGVTFGAGETNQTILNAGHGNDSDIFIAGLNADGTLAWAKRAGGVTAPNGTPSPDEGFALTADASGNSYVTGFFNHTATFGPGEAGETSLTASGIQEDVFVAAYTPTGTLAWVKRAGGTGRDESYGVAVRNREAHITGRIQGTTVIFGLGEANETTLSTSAADIFLAKFASPICGDGSIGIGETCDDGNTDNGDGCSSTCRIESVCGDGTSEGEEACDEGAANGTVTSCCSATCTLETPSKTCRSGVSVCDIAETCTGTSGACPVDTVAGSGTLCRASAGECDVAETCDGENGVCPIDTFQSDTVICRTGTSICDAAETCTGTSATCPANAFAPNTTICRPSAGGCDAAETCTGTSSTCPVDTVATADTVCRSATGLCDKVETCNGTSNLCPPDELEPPTTECRPGTDSCEDAPEFCTGTSNQCPPNTPTNEVTMGCTVNGAQDQPCQGGDGNDIIIGTPGRDVIRGGKGNDELRGQQGDDIICGEEGRDLLIGALGNDILIGGDDKDVLRGNGSGDDIGSETDNDRLLGGNGNDTLLGATGADRLDGGSGNDKLLGNDGKDVLIGGPDNDNLSGASGDDVLDGGPGIDKLDGGTETDICKNGEKLKLCEL